MAKLEERSGVVFLDGDSTFLRTMTHCLEASGSPPLASTDWQEILGWIESGEISTLVSELRMPGIDGISFLEKVQKIDPTISLVLLTSHQPNPREMKLIDRLSISYFNKISDLHLFLQQLSPSRSKRSGGDYDSISNERSRLFPPSDDLFTVFLSYGSPDEEIARATYEALSSNGVNVFFFPESALPGQRLHRTMADGIQNHDRIVLLCSQNSLRRAGVLNELEQVLAREAEEGGTEILIPITLDNFVFSDWAPNRPDLARQVQNRVIADFRNRMPASEEFQTGINRIIRCLKREGEV